MRKSPVFTFYQYILYLFRASGAHALHSPFVYTLYNELIKSSRKQRINDIEAIRRELLNNHELVDVSNALTGRNTRKSISGIAKRSLSTRKFSTLLQLLINELNAQSILETGTSLGINTMYLAKSNAEQVITLEYSPILIQLARRQFTRANQKNIQIEPGDIHQTFLPSLIKHQPDFVFLDADHRGSTVAKQVDQLLEYCPHIKCIVIHDIYWSRDMTTIWRLLIKDPRIKLSIDIFQGGILFPNKDIEKQHFTLRF